MYKYLKFIALKSESILFYWPINYLEWISTFKYSIFIYFYKNINMNFYLTVLNYV